MKLYLGVCGVLAMSGALLALTACTEDTTSSTTTGSASGSSSSGSSGMTSSSSSGSSGMTSSSSSGSSGMTSSSSGMSSSGTMGYEFCSDCTSNTTGAYVKECKTQADACIADAECQKLATCSYDMCSTDAAGGCCTFNCIKTLATPMASQTLFFALDNCVFCNTCKSLCDPGASAYCGVTAAGGTGCP